MKSSVIQTSTVNSFPVFTGERVHMQKFHMQEGLPSYLARWQETMDSMLVGVDTDNPIFIMIDQGRVAAGGYHRRPRPHIDGYWNEGLKAHSSENFVPHHPHHQYEPTDALYSHVDPPKSAHEYRNHTYSAGGWKSEEGQWNHVLTSPEAIILASDVQACRGYVGEWEGRIGEGGDLAHMDLSHLQQITLEPNRVYIGNVGFIHETLPIAKACERTLVRLNVKNWEPEFSH